MTNNKNYLTKYMDPKKHIIQLWTGTRDSHTANIVNNGFKTIFSTYDTLYLDCGYGNWLVKVAFIKYCFLSSRYKRPPGDLRDGVVGAFFWVMA